MFDRENLIKQAIRDNAKLSEASLRFVGDKILQSESKSYEGATAWWVLDRMRDYAYPNLARLVTTELQGRIPNTRAFGDQEAHLHLSLDELLTLRKEVPEIANSEKLISEILVRLLPSENVDLRRDVQRRQESLRQVYEFVSTLPRAYDSMKAHALYRILEHNLSIDLYDKALFVKYLELPRNSGIVLPQMLEKAGGVFAQLDQDYTDLMRSPRIADENR